MDMISDFPGRFFKGVELRGKKQLTLTIQDVVKEEMDDGKIKPVLHFDEDERCLVLNVTNRIDLIDRFGRKSDDWLGRKITLITQRVQGPNGMTDGIRFAPSDEDPDDEIPISDDDAPDEKPKRKFR